ncbi:MAG: dipeptide epimerase [Rhodothermaceae bacterium]|nr:MAG: dipeptide epimerase [Rhodothermaceae bacterium]
MDLSVRTRTLRLRTPFRIAHGTSTERQNLFVHLGEGVGEGALPPYLGVSIREAVAYLQRLDVASLLAADPPPLTHVLEALPPGPAPARAAVDLALHDHWAQRLGHPLYRLWGLDPSRAPLSTVTLSIPDHPAALQPALQRLDHPPRIKLKLGSGDLHHDLTLARAARQATTAELGIDANGAWSLREAAEVIPRLAELDLLFIEQPIPAGDPDDWHRLRRLLPRDLPPLIADESVRHTDDVFALAGAADGINVKLAKAGGLLPARHLIAVARALDMKVLLGCMIESSLALTAAAHLASLADFLDLDGMLHLADDPFEGLHFERGRVTPPDRPGHGAIPRKEDRRDPAL